MLRKAAIEVSVMWALYHIAETANIHYYPKRISTVFSYFIVSEKKESWAPAQDTPTLMSCNGVSLIGLGVTSWKLLILSDYMAV